jgi:hypothetical protein
LAKYTSEDVLKAAAELEAFDRETPLVYLPAPDFRAGSDTHFLFSEDRSRLVLWQPAQRGEQIKFRVIDRGSGRIADFFVDPQADRSLVSMTPDGRELLVVANSNDGRQVYEIFNLDAPPQARAGKLATWEAYVVHSALTTHPYSSASAAVIDAKSHRILVASRNGAARVIPRVEGAKAKRLSHVSFPQDARELRMLPNGQVLAWGDTARARGDMWIDIEVVDVDSGAAKYGQSSSYEVGEVTEVTVNPEATEATVRFSNGDSERVALKTR